MGTAASTNEPWRQSQGHMVTRQKAPLMIAFVPPRNPPNINTNYNYFNRANVGRTPLPRVNNSNFVQKRETSASLNDNENVPNEQHVARQNAEVKHVNGVRIMNVRGNTGHGVLKPISVQTQPGAYLKMRPPFTLQPMIHLTDKNTRPSIWYHKTNGVHTVNDNSKATLLRRDPTLIGGKMDQSKEDRGNDEGNRPKVMLRKTGAATTGIVFDNFTFVISGGSKYIVKKTESQTSMTNNTDFAKQAANQMKSLLSSLEDEGSEVCKDELKSQISFVLSVLEEVISEDSKRKGREDDDLSEVDASAVPDEVRDWLASTFTRKMGSGRRDGEKPKFKSIVNALRAGMFVERMFRRMSGLQGLSYPTALVPHLKGIDEWNVDMFALNEAANGSALKYVTYELLNRYDLVSKFKIPVSNLISFLERIESGYSVHSNPYHNLIHGADVTQTCHYFMLQTGLMNWLTDLEIFAVLIAACCHDVEHTGTTNNFHINTQSELALLYNDKSVLENHHVSHTFRVMRDFPECNILGNLSRDDFQEFRQLVVDMILATDMSFHFSQLKAMKTAITQPEPVEKTKALGLVLHTADISHPAKEWDVHYKWTMLVIEEFFQQGDREAQLGLPYSPLCDRHTLVIPDSQIGFINFIVAPSMEVCGDMMDKIVAPIDMHNPHHHHHNTISSPTSASGRSPKISTHSTSSLRSSSRTTHDKEGDNAPRKQSSPEGGGGGDRNNNSSTHLDDSFAINRPWDALIAANRDTWKQKSVEEAEQKKADEVKKKEEEEKEKGEREKRNGNKSVSQEESPQLSSSKASSPKTTTNTNTSVVTNAANNKNTSSTNS
ncbi:dual specificity calcium/calmodulin-dependent 3',5'-cyclic nucleotide phosphodiesterase 1-like isoform X2 [Convolutriloba macropyga]|uniref:dual specificity calcium/calmodulin-dependent 3',5'-cyclic nucleotide phosphodiesterase 1-like isoform X2 n=1 Tax=Convolutriloba macropyga TaxID=536237 RepID=UPI003F51BEE7